MAPRTESLPLPVEALARGEAVGKALELAEREADWITERHIELTRIPAPTFQERARGDYILEQFKELGLERVRRDVVGNVLAELPGAGAARHRRVVALTAHLDTVFPVNGHIDVLRQGGRLFAPGITDNGAGLAAVLGLARIFRESRVRLRDTLLFVANVAEEGEGNLFGMRHLLEAGGLREHLRCMLVLDGANTDHITAQALGSVRFHVIIEGPGGHSWNDYGMVNPVHALAGAITRLTAVTMPVQPRTTFTVGQVEGGTSINSIPYTASMKVDIRSGSGQEMRRLAAILDKAVRDAVEDENKRASGGRLSFEIREIGNRPAADLPEDSRLLEIVQAVDQWLGIRSRIERSSTDANIPLSMGLPAVCLGGGGQGGAAHSLSEWYDPAERALGLRRLVLITCALAGVES